MRTFNQAKSIASWSVFTIALVVYYFSAERVGSLWDCGEFILGAYKLQVVHPPGAPLFMLIGRIFTLLPDWFSSDPANISFAVNLMSGVCTAFTAFFACRIAMLFGHNLLSDKETEDSTANLVLLFTGLCAGLATAFCSSIWFSAVEGEVYAMSTMFTAMTFWAATTWYFKPDTRDSDRWLLLSIYFGALSIGVHLLSLLAFPAIGLMYYFKKYQKVNLGGILLSMVCGSMFIIFIQKFVIVGITSLWDNLDIFMVNQLGAPFHSGLVVTILLLGGAFYFLLRLAHRRNSYLIQFATMAGLLSVLAFSTIGVIVIRANADTPINMNVPSDATRLLPYLNREQYGERPLLFGPTFVASPEDMSQEDRYGRVGDSYKIVDRKLDYVFANKDKMFFPRIGHSDPGRPEQHMEWYKAIYGKELKGKPGFGYNMQYFVRYQIGWMYWRYFMWNFSGRQNAEQGYKPWDLRKGHWITGINFIDRIRLYDTAEITDTMKAHEGTNKYYMLPFLFGLFGMIFQGFKRPKDFAALFLLFLITGIGIILYSNQPPIEPRERDYVLVGSFFTFCIWIGLGVLAIFDVLKDRLAGNVSALVAGCLVLVAPLLMAFQNFDDHSRMTHYASRDYASNFLNSVEKDAIIFTYGDNDTYPLWYAQEVENIRTDVRVVNLSLIAVDWYINKLTRKVNESEALKLSIPLESYRGNLRNQVFFYSPNPESDLNQPLNVYQELQFIGNKENVVQGQTISRTRNFMIPVNPELALKRGWIDYIDSTLVEAIPIRFNPKSNYMTKDELAVMDVIASNIYDRPIYFAITCKNDKLLALNDFTEVEGLGLRIVPRATESDRTLSIYGSGRVNTEVLYDNVMNKWKWGNFDKDDTFIDESYAAEIQAMKLIMMRGADAMESEGKTQEAANISKQFFEAFPNYNFPYDNTVVPFIEVLFKTGNIEEGKKHLRILANEAFQQLEFYASLDEDEIGSFSNDSSYAVRTLNECFNMAQELVKDDAFNKELQDAYGKFDMRNMKK